MRAMTRLLLAAAGVLHCMTSPVKALACNASGSEIWVSLQLENSGQVAAEWPLVKGRIHADSVCVEKDQLQAQLFSTASMPLFIQPATDLLMVIDNTRQGIAAQWKLDVYGVAGLPTRSGNDGELQSSCVIQHLEFSGEPSAGTAASYQVNAQAQIQVLGNCQGAGQIKKSMSSIEGQWTLGAAFIIPDIQKNTIKTPSAEKTGVKSEQKTEVISEGRQEEKPENKLEKPSALEKFINLPSADDDAKKRMKKR